MLTGLLFSISTLSQLNKSKIKITDTSLQPLVVVNKVVANKNLLQLIPEENIKSVTILKDKEAILKYKELGKNGVIEITTKDISKRKLKQILKTAELELIPKNTNKLFKFSGNITDCENIPIPNVQIKNTTLNKIEYTDSLGKFSVTCRLSDSITFSKQNYQQQKLQITSEKEINIQLKEIQRNQILIKKPVIYLYPKEKTDIELSIYFEGKLGTTFPKLEKSWNVTAYENGQIFDKKTSRFYTSLFWDGEITFPAAHYQYKTGFVVEKEKLTSFLIEKLEFMGLSTAETNDFIQYWLPILEVNPYTFIHFLVNDAYTVFSTNTIHPKPETSIRVMMEFFGVDEIISIAPQQLPSTKRKGFTLVEWGGSDVSNVIDVNELLENKHIQKYITLNKEINFEKQNPIYIIDKKMVSKKKFNKLTCDDIIQIEVLNSKKAPALFGEKGIFGAIIVTTNKKP